MPLNIKCAGHGHITTYLLNLDDKIFCFDFCFDKTNYHDIEKIDYLFISHEHMDHMGSLLDYDLMKHLNHNVRIFTSKTTKELLSYLIEKELEHYTKNAKELILSFIKKIEVCFFNETLVLNDNLSLTLYRSGHTFGSSMIYLQSKDTKLLYTGDIDFVKNEGMRQYNLPYNLEIDYIIVDGTNLFKDDYKGVSYKAIKEYINKTRKNDLKYYVRPEKAIHYALYLAEKLDNVQIIYTDYMKWYLKIITSEGYNPYIVNKVFYDLKIFQDKHFEGKTIYLVGDENKYDLNYRLSLHISRHDFLELLNNHLNKDPKKILIGHYDKEVDESTLDLMNYPYQILRKGVNIIE